MCKISLARRLTASTGLVIFTTVMRLHQKTFYRGRREGNVVPGLAGTNGCTSWLMHSDAEGATWSAPRDLTAQLKRATATSLASGPGIGYETENPNNE